MLKKSCESYEKLKKEVEDQLKLQEKFQDNMLAGFIVGFVIMVMICMLPRTLLASQWRHFGDLKLVWTCNIGKYNLNVNKPLIKVFAKTI